MNEKSSRRDRIKSLKHLIMIKLQKKCSILLFSKILSTIFI